MRFFIRCHLFICFPFFSLESLWWGWEDTNISGVQMLHGLERDKYEFLGFIVSIVLTKITFGKWDEKKKKILGLASERQSVEKRRLQKGM